jgi:outer membrane biosynthesis protein TonB
VYQVIPDVSQPILNKIRGHIVVKVRVLVDPTGTVVGQFMENAGPSRYFARLAAEAAAEWKFSPGAGRDARVWLLRFEFERSGATVQSSSAP